MQLDKQEVVDLLRKEGKNEHVQKALQELPDKIDHEQHAQMLQQKFGIDPGSSPRRQSRRSFARRVWRKAADVEGQSARASDEQADDVTRQKIRWSLIWCRASSCIVGR